MATSNEKTLMTHRLSGGGTHNRGYDALRWDSILHGDCGEYGRYHDLSVLPDKIARYLFEFDSDSYASFNLPLIPEDRSLVAIHSLLNPPQVLNTPFICIFGYKMHIIAYISIYAVILYMLHILHINRSELSWTPCRY